MKSAVTVKSIPGTTTKGTKHHVRGYLEGSSPDTAILHFGSNNLKNNENAKNIETGKIKWQYLAIFAKYEKKTSSLWYNRPK